MKTIIIGDTHFSENLSLLESSIDFFEQYIIPNKKYKYIIFEGDIFNNKKTIDANVLNIVMEKIFDKLMDRKIFMILGNHDSYYKNSNEVSTLNIIDRIYKNIEIIKDDEIVKVNRKNIYMIPYGKLPDKNKIDQCDFVVGHIELYPYYPKSIIKIEDFNNKPVYLGHYHLQDGPYIGTPYWLDFNDIDEDKGFFEINNDNSLTFIKNNSSIQYMSIYYDKEYLMIKGEKVSHDEFKNNINWYKKHKYYLYIDNEKDAEDFMTFLDINNIFYITKFTNEPTEEDEDIEYEKEDIFNIIEYLLESKEDKDNFIEIINKIKEVS